MSRLAHTVQIAVAFNARVIDDDGLPVAAWLMPVLYLALWWPGWLWGKAGLVWRVLFGPGWLEDLQIMVDAVRGLWVMTVARKAEAK